MRALRRAIRVGCMGLTVGWAASGVAAEPLAEAKAKIAQCIEEEDWEYQAARSWLVLQPEALQAIPADSWQERWVKEICVAWPRNSSVYNKVMAGFRRAEYGASRADNVGVGDARREARQLARLYGDRLVPLMVECLWKTGRRWRGYRAWRTSAVVEYLKLVGDSSILDPAIEVLVSGPRDAQQIPEPDSEEPSPVSGGMKALADLMDQMGPYRPVELILTFGDENTLAKLESVMESPETGRASKEVLKRTIELLGERLERKRSGQSVEKVGPHDLYVEFGDAATVESMRMVWGRGVGAFAQKMRQAAEELEARLERETREGAKVKLVQCSEGEGEEYIEARNWLIKHPGAFDLMDKHSWEHRWVKRICEGWMEHRELYEQRIRGFESAEMGGRISVAVCMPDALFLARNASGAYGDKLVPLMVECHWKSGRKWRHFKAWRIVYAVEYLKLEGDRSVLEPAIEVLASQSWDSDETLEAGSEYPRMDRVMTAAAHLIDQMAPYRPVELILTFGNESTLADLKSVMDGPETGETLREVLRKTIALLEERLEAKRQGQAVEKVGPHDLYAEFGDATTAENMRTLWGRARGPYAEKFHRATAKLEKRLEEEEKSEK